MSGEMHKRTWKHLSNGRTGKSTLIPVLKGLEGTTKSMEMSISMSKYSHFGLIALDGAEMDYKVFTSNLANLHRLKVSKENLEAELDLIIYDLGGVKGVHYDSVMVHGNPSVIEEKRLELIDKYNEKEKELEFTKLAIMQTEDVLNRMPKTLREMLVEIYVDGKTFKKVGMIHGYSDNGLWHWMKRETEKFL